MMIHHVSFGCGDYPRALKFYDAVLQPLGYSRQLEFTAAVAGFDTCGYGRDGQPAFWLGSGKSTAGKGLHVAFLAPDRASVDAFYKAAIAAGGRDNGAPGLRPHYHANYYGAFVFDLDGHAIEACCHKPE